jgi:hypothetical protein
MVAMAAFHRMPPFDHSSARPRRRFKTDGRSVLAWLMQYDASRRD